MVDLAFDDGSKLTATDGHPFWDVSTGLFTEAVDLMVGELVLTLEGQSLKIISVRVHGEDLTAYNLEIEGIHTYYAGQTPVLVHNDCDMDADGIEHALNNHTTGGADYQARVASGQQVGCGMTMSTCMRSHTALMECREHNRGASIVRSSSEWMQARSSGTLATGVPLASSTPIETLGPARYSPCSPWHHRLMSIWVVVRNEMTEQIEGASTVSFQKIVSWENRWRFPMLGFVDPLGKTVMNRLQVKALVDELTTIRTAI